MKFLKTSNLYSLNKSTYVNLRWIAYIGQISAILIVQFLFEYKFNYFICISIIFFSVLTNLYLQFKIKDNQLNNSTSTMYLSYDIFQLGILLFFTGGVSKYNIDFEAALQKYDAIHWGMKGGGYSGAGDFGRSGMWDVESTVWRDASVLEVVGVISVSQKEDREVAEGKKRKR